MLGEEQKGNRGITYGLGIDAGGTYTDAEIHDFKQNNVQRKNKALHFLLFVAIVVLIVFPE